LSESSRNLFYRKMMISGWGFITIVLLVIVFLLMNERAEQRRSFSSAATPQALSRALPGTAPLPRPGENEQAVRLYFALADASGLVPENRTIRAGDSTVENCRLALEALFEGPRTDLFPVAPSTVSVRAVYALEGGRLVVDLSRELAQGLPRSTTAEMLFVQSLAHTLAQPQLRTADGLRVSSVRILIEGFPAANSFASHLDLSDFITPDPVWARAAQPPA
jgi:hypothetical protein